MSAQPKALIVANWLESDYDCDDLDDMHEDAANELRRLHAANANLVEALEFVEGLYSHDSSVGSNSLSLYEACCIARGTLANNKLL